MEKYTQNRMPEQACGTLRPHSFLWNDNYQMALQRRILTSDCLTSGSEGRICQRERPSLALHSAHWESVRVMNTQNIVIKMRTNMRALVVKPDTLENLLINFKAKNTQQSGTSSTCDEEWEHAFHTFAQNGWKLCIFGRPTPEGHKIQINTYML